MPIKPEQLATLMREVEQEDPIDFADLPFPEDALRQLVATHLCEMAASMENFSTEDRLMTLLAVSAKLVLENLVLRKLAGEQLDRDAVAQPRVARAVDLAHAAAAEQAHDVVAREVDAAI